MPYGQVGQFVLTAQVEKPLAAEPAAIKARRVLVVFGRVGIRPHRAFFAMQGNAVVSCPFNKRRMVIGGKAGIDVQGHNFKGKWDDALPVAQYLEQNKRVHSTGYGNADTGMRMDVLCLLHEFASGGNTGFLGKIEFGAQ